eukprot:g8940.t1
MEFKTYKELQALAKLHGIRANLSKAALIDKLASEDEESSSRCNAEKPQANPGRRGCTPGTPRDEADTPSSDSAAPEGNFDKCRLDDADKPQDKVAVPGIAVDARVDTNAAVPDPVEPKVLVGRSDRRNSERLSSAQTESPATLDQVVPEVPVESSERRKSDRLSAATGARSVTQSSRNAKTTTKTKLKKPTRGPAGRFERMHQHLFAGQASIETYGKTPKKKTAPARENIPFPKVTPGRPVAFGSGVKSAKRGLTVASKPCTLVVQRSSKKPTQIKEFRLSSNQSAKREPFKPYSGPVRPFNLANNGASFNVGSSSSSSAQVPQRSKTKLGIKSTLASGKAKSARKNAHVQSSKSRRLESVTGARVGRG